MNCLVFHPGERDGERVTLTGARLTALRTRHTFAIGQEIVVAELKGKLGTGHIDAIDQHKVEIKVRLTDSPPRRHRVELIVAVSRPQTVKKILQAATTGGAQRVTFVRAAQSERSYLDSSALDPIEIEDEIIKGLEQCIDSVPPEVRIFDRFRPYIEDVLSHELRSYRRYLGVTADPRAREPFPLVGSADALDSVLLAVGPERGWNSYELEQFHQRGFIDVTLGERILRVETAATMLLSQALRCVSGL